MFKENPVIREFINSWPFFLSTYWLTSLQTSLVSRIFEGYLFILIQKRIYRISMENLLWAKPLFPVPVDSTQHLLQCCMYCPKKVVNEVVVPTMLAAQDLQHMQIASRFDGWCPNLVGSSGFAAYAICPKIWTRIGTNCLHELIKHP